MAIIFVGAVTFSSCEKHELQTAPEQQTSNYQQNITKVGDIIKFNSEKQFVSVVEYLNGLDYESYKNWKKNNNVQLTMYDIYHRAVTENDSIDRYYSSLTDSEYQQLKKDEMPEFSEYTKEMAKKGYLNLIYNDTIAVVEMPTWASVYSKILTPDGKFLIGDTLYKFTKNSFTATDLKSDKIIYGNSKYEVDWPVTNYSTFKKNNKEYKVQIYARYIQYYTSRPYFKSIYIVNLEFFKKSRGKWVNKNTRWTVNGSYTLNHTDLNWHEVNEDVDVNVSHSSRDDYINIVYSSINRNADDYRHVPRISTNNFYVSTLKGSTYVHHLYPSYRLK